MISLTLTGVDEWADHEYLKQLAPYCEFGFLFSMGNTGRRYASLGTILYLMARSEIKQASLHVCGDHAMRILREGKVKYLLDPYFQRIQVNGSPSLEYVEEVCAFYPKHTVITQHKEGNEGLLEVKAQNHALLVDGSGGSGSMPKAWAAPLTDKRVGFAGGLTPDNLPTELQVIAQLSKAGAWVDMESGLRNAEDKFDIGRAYEAIKAVTEFNERAQ